MRFLIPVVVGGALVALRYWNELDAVPWPIQLGFLALVALGVGFFTGSRGWLAALAAFVIGHALWIAVELRPSLPWSASDVWDWTQWWIFLTTLLPTAIGAAVLGALGARVRLASLRRTDALRTG